MRVLQIVESFGGGVGRHVVDLSAGLLERGHEVDLIYASARMDVGTTAGLAKLVHMGAATFELPLTRSPGPADLGAIREIKAYIRKHGPFDVVHGQSSKGGALARLAGHHYPAVVVYTPHAISTMNPTLSGKSKLMLSTIEKALAPKADAIICVSGDEEKHIIGLGIDPQKLHLVPNGIVLPEERPARAANKTVGFVGRLEPQKDPLNLIEAFARNADRHPDWTLAMVGYGPLEAEAKGYAEAQGLAGRVRWLGNQPGEEAMRGFEIFCLPSRYEAMPYVLLEALAAGVPIVSTDCGGARLAIEPETNGLIVPIQNPVELAKALDRLMGDDALRATMADAAWRKASEFSQDRMVEATLKVYESLMAEKRKRAR